MLSRLKDSGLIWPAAMTLLMLVVLVGLGNWQMRRLAWKEGLIARIEARVKGAPMTLAKAEAIWRKSGDIEYLRVRARGRFQHDKERFYFTTERGQTGWHVYTPMWLGAASAKDGGKLLFVNRGFVPDSARAASSRPEGQVSGVVEIVGLLRKPGPKGLFTPANNVAKNAWYWRDLSNMVASIGDKIQINSYPFFLDVESGSRPQGGLPRGGATRLVITNKHLEYALTWYGLALTLIGVFLVFARGRLKPAKRPS